MKKQNPICLAKKFIEKVPYLHVKIIKFLKSFWRRFQNLNTYKIQYVCGPNGISLIKNTISKACAFYPYSKYYDFNITQLRILSRGFHRHLEKKYSHPHAKIIPGDTVIDCGGFVGGFTIAASTLKAKKIYYIEPTPLSRECAKMNFLLNKISDKVVELPCGLSNSDSEGKLNLSLSMADNSLLAPDEGGTNESIDIKLTTLDILAKRFSFDSSRTFLKVEAEGHETEIIEGMKTFRPRTIAIDVTPERNGVSPRQDIKNILQQYGYVHFWDTSRCLFAVYEQRP